MLFNKKMAAAGKEISSRRVKFEELWRIQDKVYSKLKVLETEFGKYLEVVSEQTTEGSTTMPIQFETEIAQCLELIFANLMCRAARVLAFSKISFQKSISGGQCGTANHTVMVSNRLSSTCWNSLFDPSASASGTSPGADGTAPSSPAGNSFNAISQKLVLF